MQTRMPPANYRVSNMTFLISVKEILKQRLTITGKAIILLVNIARRTDEKTMLSHNNNAFKSLSKNEFAEMSMSYRS